MLYNENDPKAAAWLRELIAQGHLPHGNVDERSIVDLTGADYAPTSHFFAGIGGWPYALELAGWPADRPVWTGSCPCQPFSVAGKGKGEADERHLWPEFRRLIAECRPATIFGEQVASRAGREWLAGVRADLEGLGYAVGAADLCAASAGAPHIRQRLFWVADRKADGREQERADGRGSDERGDAEGRAAGPRLCGASGGLAYSTGREAHAADAGSLQPGDGGGVGGVANSDPGGRDGTRLHLPEREQGEAVPDAAGAGAVGGVGHADHAGSQGRIERGDRAGERTPWASGVDLPCRDGRTRRVPTQPELFPLAHGVPARVVRLRGYGNAIVPHVAATFVRAFLEVEKDYPRSRRA